MKVIKCADGAVEELLAELAKPDHLVFLVVGAKNSKMSNAVSERIDFRAPALVPSPLSFVTLRLHGTGTCLSDPRLTQFELPGPVGTVAYGYGRFHKLSGTIHKTELEVDGVFDPTLVPFSVDSLILAAIAQTNS